MKKLLPFAFLAIILISCEKENLTPVPEKDDTPSEVSLKASATISSESALMSAVKNAKPGDVITISGTIYLTKTLELATDGTSSKRITLTGGTLDCSRIPSGGWGVKLNGSYWNVENMDIKNAPDCGLVLQHGGYNEIKSVRAYKNGDSGIQIYNKAHHNWVKWCTSYDNYDRANGGENADGFACKLSAGAGNVFYKCNAIHNSDDGWDLYGQPYTVKMYYCRAEKNGYGTNGDGNGFKLGSAGQNVVHYVRYCTSNNNKKCGYDGNGNKGHIYRDGSGGSGNGQALWSRID
jgi:hypothetical protein